MSESSGAGPSRGVTVAVRSRRQDSTQRIGASLSAPIESVSSGELPDLDDRQSVFEKPDEGDLGRRYRVMGAIGQGGMGQVYRVFDGDLGREVAAKMVRAGQTGDEFTHRFIQEAQATSQLEHPHIIPIHDFGQTGSGHLYFTMTLVRGRTLGEVVDELRAGPGPAHAAFGWVRRLQIVQAICEALAFAHQRGVLHRDLKPANVMVGALGEVLVMDWGLAKIASSEVPRAAGPVSRSSKPVSQDGLVLGTPAYMAPELLQGAPHDERVDVYAIGATMYELFALVPPHQGETPLQIFDSAKNRDPAEPETLAVRGQGRVPREVSLIIMRALARDPARRYATALELHADIQRYLQGVAHVVCVQTALKRGVSTFGVFVDNHGKLAIALVTAAAVVPLVVLAKLIELFF